MRNLAAVTVAACTSLLAGCGVLSLTDQFMEGGVRGTVTGPAGPVADARVAVYTVVDCTVCIDDLISTTTTGAEGRYLTVIAMAREEVDSEEFALVVTPPEGSGLRQDTVPFTASLDSFGTDTVTVDVTLSAAP